MLTPLDFSQNKIPTPSEACTDSFCSGEHNVQTVENNQDNFDNWKTVLKIVKIVLC